ncbi:DUF6314 family protein [Rhodobacter lacus]|uniref:DUF6314 family protein n=1 Tax=Rhodobacter lacus TaxID=1641972 RepID=A0ABW5AB87_9RHOB
MTRAITDFEGLWQMERWIDDRFGGQPGHFIGTAELQRDAKSAPPGTWNWNESGYLTLGEETPVLATRTYLWRPVPPRIEVFFEDGRPFHAFALSGQATAAHWCDPDDYRVDYDFSRWPDWSATWRVSGPHKDYEMISRYKRA